MVPLRTGAAASLSPLEANNAGAGFVAPHLFTVFLEVVQSRDYGKTHPRMQAEVLGWWQDRAGPGLACK